MKPLSRDEVRRIDALAIERLGVTGLVLMENAGRGCTDVLEHRLGGLVGRSIAIVAGTGNNGGDGLVMARHLLIRGASPSVLLVGDPDRMTHDAAVNYRILLALGQAAERLTGESVTHLAKRLARFDLVVDAVGGTGIRGALRGEPAEVVRQINAAGPDVLAVDIPTGLDCDTGQADGPAVRAALTVTMVARKIGFDAPQARQYTGQVHVVDIGIPPQWARQQQDEAGASPA